MNIWFTADHHFGHANIIKPDRANRPFADVREMDEALILAWNERVQKRDFVYHLGDLAWKDPLPYLKRLNGSIVLIRGNHDEDMDDHLDWLAGVFDVKLVSVIGQKIWLSHYAHRVWPESHYGAWHLYGHSHGTLPDDPFALSMDIGIDTRKDYAPYSLPEIRSIMAGKKFKPADHHGTLA